MKKIFAIALAIIMTLSVVLGCSNSKKETPPAASCHKTVYNRQYTTYNRKPQTCRHFASF